MRPRPASLVALAFFALLAGCATVREPDPDPPPSKPLHIDRPGRKPDGPDPLIPRSGAGDLAVARVGGAEILRSDIGDFLIRYFRDQAREALTHLIDEKMIEAEAGHYGIVLPEGALDRAVTDELSRRESEVRAEIGPEISLENYLRERYGIALADHRRDLERLFRIRLLRDRVIRLHEMRQDRIEARDAVFATEAEARRAAKATRAGADLARLAAEFGRRKGVVLPPFPRGELEPEELSDAVFALGPGQVSDPIAVTERGRTDWHVFKVVRVMPARDVAWSEVRDEIEEGLEKKSLDTWEYLQWAREMREKYGVKIL